jgi:hypothetical protein
MEKKLGGLLWLFDISTEGAPETAQQLKCPIRRQFWQILVNSLTKNKDFKRKRVTQENGFNNEA